MPLWLTHAQWIRIGAQREERSLRGVLHHIVRTPSAVARPARPARLIAIAALAECVYHLEAGDAPGKEIAAAGEYALLQFGLAQTALDDFARDAEPLET